MLIVKNVLTFTKTFLKLFPSRVIYTDEKIEIVACNSCSFMIENVFKNFAWTELNVEKFCFKATVDGKGVIFDNFFCTKYNLKVFKW